ncbi:hypothetical protein ACQRIU_007024 [Beauveria bassiana]
MSLHTFWGASRLSNTRSSSVTSRTSARQATDPNVPIRSTEATSDLEQTLHRSTCPPHSLSFQINWSVLRRHDGTVLKGIQYRIRDKRTVGGRVKVSWIYSYGAELEHSHDKYCLCAECHTKKRYSSQLFAAESTTAAIQHLVEFHKVKRPSILADDDDDTEPGSAAAFQLVMPFNEEEYKQKLIDWVITLRLSYREVANEATTELLTYGKPSLARLLPTHHSILSQWVKDSLAARLPFVIKLVQSALSDINLSIDGWRAHNRREYAAICAHFVDSDGSPRTLLLGFPRRHGGHTGDDLAALVKPVILHYINRNDARREVLRTRMRATKTGDGKLFIGVLLSDGGIRWNATHYMIERALKCRPAIDLYQAQWKPPDKNDKHKNDFLTDSDWHELELFYTLLQPFERLTKRLQGRAEGEGNEGGQGSVWQVLYAMDFLLTKLESVKEEIDIVNADSDGALPSYYSAGVLAAWSKINTYYELTDQSPIYRMAIALHPAYQFDYFREKWWRREEWIKTAEKELTAYYDRFAAVAVANQQVDQADTSRSSSPTIDDEFDAWGHMTDRPHRGKRRRVETEWEMWMKQVPSREDMAVKNPTAWWVARRHAWPVLSKLALNIFSTPAMSAEPERVFSDGGELITDKRNGLGDDTVEAEMLQKNWISSKVLRDIATPQSLYELPK